MPPVKLDRYEFTEQLERNQGMLIFKFGATWCKPCEVIRPVFHDLLKSPPDHVKIFEIDIDESSDLYSYLSRMKQLRSIPAILIYMKGNLSVAPDATHVGANVTQLRQFLTYWLLGTN